MGESMLDNVVLTKSEFGADRIFGFEKTSTLENDVGVRPKRPPRELYRPPQRRNQVVPPNDEVVPSVESSSPPVARDSWTARGKSRVSVSANDSLWQGSKSRQPLADRACDVSQSYSYGRFPRQRGYFARGGFRVTSNGSWVAKGAAADNSASRKDFENHGDQFRNNRRSFPRRRYGAESSRFVSRQSARTVADVHGRLSNWNISTLRRCLIDTPFGRKSPSKEENAFSDEEDTPKSVIVKSNLSEKREVDYLSECDAESEEEECDSESLESEQRNESLTEEEEQNTAVSVGSPATEGVSVARMDGVLVDGEESDQETTVGILRLARSTMAKIDDSCSNEQSRKELTEPPLFAHGRRGKLFGNGILCLPIPISCELESSRENRSSLSSDTDATLSYQIAGGESDLLSVNDDDTLSFDRRDDAAAEQRAVFLKKVKNEVGADLAVIDSLVNKIQQFLLHQKESSPEDRSEFKRNLQSVVSLYEKLLHQRLEWHLRAALEKRLWKDTFHAIVETMRDKAASELEDDAVRRGYLKVIERASNLYANLLQWYKREFDLDLPDYTEYLVGNLERPVQPYRLPKSVDSKQAFASCQRFVIALADLARYKGSAGIPSGYVESSKFSTQAVHLVPHNGRPYNQLALLANEKNLRLEVAYYLIRALAVKRPVGSASDMLTLIYKNVEKESSFLDQYTASCHEEKGFMAREISRKNWNCKVEDFRAWLDGLTTEQAYMAINAICSMLRLHLALYLGVQNERFSTYARPALVLLAELFERPDNPLTALQLVRYIMICLFGVHWSLHNADTWCEVVELSVRFVLSIFYLLISILHENVDDFLRGNVCEIVRKVLPAVHVLCQWISTTEVYELVCRAPQLDWFNDPRDKDMKWSIFANLCNRLETEKSVKKFSSLDQGKRSGGKNVILLEDLECCAFFKVFPTYPTTYCVSNETDEVGATLRLRFASLLNLAYYLDGKDSAFFAYDTRRNEFAGFSCLKCLNRHRAQPRSAASDDGDDLIGSDSEERLTINGDDAGPVEHVSLDVLKTASRQRKVMLQEERSLGKRIIDLIRYAVVDTNSLIDHLDAVFHLIKARKLTVVVPTIVYNELVGIDKSSEKPEAQARARSAIKLLQQFSRDPNYSVKSVTCSGTLLDTFMFSKNEETIKLENMNDDLIADICVQMSIKEGVSESDMHFRKVALLTEDRNLKIKAYGLRLSLFPDTSLSLIERAGPEELNILAKKLYSDFHGVDESEKQFDFLIQKVLLRTSIGDFVVDNNLSSENVIVVECIDREPAPDPCFSLPHKDWVSGVRCASDCIISACYDGSVHAWTLAAEPIGQFKAHQAIINGLCLIPASSDDAVVRIATASADQSVVMMEFNRLKSKFTRTHVGQGHEESVLCVSSNAEGSRLATGGLDNYLKIWNADSPKDVAKDWADEQRSKPAKTADSVAIITPIVTLAGHRSRITGTCWMNEDHVITSSWDHTICVWDTILLDRVSSLSCSCSLTAVSYSPLNQLLISGSTDDHVRLWDPRSHEGKMVRSIFAGHSKWVSAVDWSKTNEHLFISASYDALMKLWDFRSTKVPLYDLSGHSDRILCCDFSSPSFMLSGGVDGRVNVYRTTKQ
ncbi:hypothetical protein M514_10582 [Trichuris suis]|uniref:PIN domain-containing protein n=1 Tax=Trichuris suis TaxID=68888 RepID=A0A085NPP6_9BILA|nr:hypothetical protein M514_10582 [Trichuris suis]